MPLRASEEVVLISGTKKGIYKYESNITAMTVMEVITVMDVFEKIESVAKIIGVAPSTIKKYYLLFEEEGYKFKRSNEGYVLFSEYDIELLKELIILKNQSGMTVKKAVKQLVKDEVITDMTDTTDVTAIAKQVTTVISELDELKQLVKDQSELIKQQQRYIDERLEKRDQFLLESLRQGLEVHKQIAIAEEAKEKAKESKKGFFSRLFGK